MEDVKIEKCQYCGGEEFIEGRVAARNGTHISTGGLRYAELYATVCRDCGSVVRIFCNTPEKLYPKKERRE